MATRAELAKYEAQRKHDAKHPKKAKKAPKHKKATPNAAHAKSHAPYAIEPQPAKGTRPSRRSSRASKNHKRGDTSLLLSSDDKARAPEQRARRAKAKASKVRGSK